eukprot:c9021_g1_i2.p1 GENE.c9021_g1_i2~~c9021_g1_i2.p1  ORF type:complete len:145 (-),score=33.44 c9021_g1_i2:76-510(-)
MDANNVEKFRLPILATFAYFVLYYVFLFSQSKVKLALMKEAKKKGEKFIPPYYSTEKRMLCADRTAANMLEQLPPFLVSMWMYAVFVDANVAGYLGLAYTAIRSFYPFVFGSMKALYVTIPNYLIIYYMLFVVFVRVVPVKLWW